MMLERALVARSLASVVFAALLVASCGDPSTYGTYVTPPTTSAPTAAPHEISLRAEAAGTVLGVNTREAIICVSVAAATADVRGGCYDLRVRTDVRRGDEVKIYVANDASNDGNKRDEVVAIHVLRAA